MELESYFDFLNEEDIRIKGTRIGIETVLDDYFDGISPEEIAVRYGSLTLEQVYATITYYLQNREKVNAYLEVWREYSEQARREQERNPSHHSIIPLFHHSRCEHSEPKYHPYPRQHWFLKKIQLSIFLLNTIDTGTVIHDALLRAS
jgi:uncharacterized protein (DUF433 family)